MTGRREQLLLIGLMALLVTLTVLTVQAQGDDESDRLPGSTYANGRVGARAFYLWLDAMGYDTARFQPDAYRPHRLDGVLWLISPTQYVEVEEAESLREWVETGGILVAVDVPDFTLEEVFELESASGVTASSTLYPTVPWLKSPNERYFSWQRYVLPNGATPLMVDAAGRVGAFYMPVGAGELWLLPDSTPFTNVALRNESQSEFAESVLAQLPDDVTHHFDEFHHGFGGGFAFDIDRGLVYQMLRSPWGWGLLYAVGIGAMWLILRGRRFGRAIPLPNEHLRREAGEYVQGLAWLYRRARLRAPIMRHYHQQMKRRVTERYRLPLSGDDSAFLSALSQVRPDVNVQALGQHLRALQSKIANERQLQALAEAHQAWLKQLVD